MRKFQRIEKKPNCIIVAEGKNVGEVGFKMISESCRLISGSTETFYDSFVKSDKLMFLRDDLKGSIDMYRTIVNRQEPFEKEHFHVATGRCGRHCTCDKDEGERYLVVLEEARPHAKQRRVLLFRPPNPPPVDVYKPPAPQVRAMAGPSTAPDKASSGPSTTPDKASSGPSDMFQPTDVCFLKLSGAGRQHHGNEGEGAQSENESGSEGDGEGNEVLLVSDAAHDAIHVVRVEGGKLRFERYLAPGCPLLLQPTALNADSRGRLWVACRGGDVLMCEPIASSEHASSEHAGSEHASSPEVPDTSSLTSLELIQYLEMSRRNMFQF